MAGIAEIKEVICGRDLTRTKAQVEAQIKEVFAVLDEVVKADGKVSVKGFGTFKYVKTSPRVGRNPSTGEPIQVPARDVIKFYATK